MIKRKKKRKRRKEEKERRTQGDPQEGSGESQITAVERDGHARRPAVVHHVEMIICGLSHLLRAAQRAAPSAGPGL